ARRLGLPIVALVDTNCDPDEADYVIPGNDDAIRACDLIVRVVADGIAAGQQKATPADFKRPAATNGAASDAPTVPEGDYEQVSPGEELVAEAPVAEAPVAEAPVAEAPVAEAPVAEPSGAEPPVAAAPVE